MRSSSEVSRPIIFCVNNLSISIVILDRHSAAKSLFSVDDASLHIWHEFSIVSLVYNTEVMVCLIICKRITYLRTIILRTVFSETEKTTS